MNAVAREAHDEAWPGELKELQIKLRKEYLASLPEPEKGEAGAICDMVSNACTGLDGFGKPKFACCNLTPTNSFDGDSALPDMRCVQMSIG